MSMENHHWLLGRRGGILKLSRNLPDLLKSKCFAKEMVKLNLILARIDSSSSFLQVSVGDGLSLPVQKSGSKYWRFRYSIN